MKTHYILVWRDGDDFQSTVHTDQTAAIEDYSDYPAEFCYGIEMGASAPRIITVFEMDRLLEDYERDQRYERAHHAALNSVYLTGRI